MTSGKHEGQPAGSVEPPAFIRFFNETLAVAEVEISKIVRDPTEMFTRAVQPVLWLAIFGQVFSRVRGIPTGNVSYLAFMTPGILAQSVLFSAIFYGIAAIWERDLGIIHKLLVSPAGRAALISGKALSSGFRGIVQVAIVYCIASLMGIKLVFSVTSVAGVTLMVVLGSAIFSTFSLIIACIVKTRERFMGIGQILTMPLFFASNAIYPLDLMPGWLKVLAHVNPLTYLVDSLRGMLISGGASVHALWFNFIVMAVVYLVFLMIAVVLYPSIVK